MIDKVDWDKAELVEVQRGNGATERYPKGRCVSCGLNVYLGGLCESCYTKSTNTNIQNKENEVSKSG